MTLRGQPRVEGVRVFQAKGRCSRCYQTALSSGELVPRKRAVFNGKEIQCQKCNRMLCVSKFKRKLSTTSGYEYTCRFCSKIFERYSITDEIYRKMYTGQGGKCAICPEDIILYARATHIDHDHSCCSGGKSCGKCVRGLLCHPCNLGLGAFKDNPESLLKAIDYLKGTL